MKNLTIVLLVVLGLTLLGLAGEFTKKATKPQYVAVDAGLVTSITDTKLASTNPDSTMYGKWMLFVQLDGARHYAVDPRLSHIIPNQLCEVFTDTSGNLIAR